MVLLVWLGSCIYAWHVLCETENCSQTDLDLANMSLLLNSDWSSLAIVVFSWWYSVTALENRQTKKPKQRWITDSDIVTGLGH